MDNIPAFPGKQQVNDYGGHYCIEDHPGMTLRDYFAAKAMEALINAKGEEFDRIAEVPEYAYQIADAMLEARGK